MISLLRIKKLERRKGSLFRGVIFITSLAAVFARMFVIGNAFMNQDKDE